MSETAAAETIAHVEDRTAPRGAYEAFLLLVGLGFVALVFFVFAFGYWGEHVVEGLDAACAEAVFNAANKLLALGHEELAIQRFRQAMAGHFRDEERRYMCGRALGDLLKKRQRYDEAIEVYRSLPAEAYSFAGAYAGFVDALWRQGMLNEAEKLSAVWLTKAQEENDARQAEWAHGTLMKVAEQRGQTDEALAHGRAALEANPASELVFPVARALERQGKKDEALNLLNVFLEHCTNEALRTRAEQLKAQLAGPPGA
ncbi:MAG: hypothetical protein KA184_07705 [Candidatus Hydrogenedentes bacterium]|nr:hypothetical protein [Candidatus Hydrogenedentota bacterium]